MEFVSGVERCKLFLGKWMDEINNEDEDANEGGGMVPTGYGCECAMTDV